jgi:hypothetical protein
MILFGGEMYLPHGEGAVISAGEGVSSEKMMV